MTADRRAALVEKVVLAMYQADDYYVSNAHAIAAIDLIRAEVLEEAAGVAETYLYGHEAATAIRALKEGK